ncbi:TetR/AcrR family transcriptional regulator [Rhodococcus sp. MEB064]|uniref:TetR/AcrR family transcriptional regulator n=1 Tax=Rhodococcus sp. MEB064 TaxID=1587522 RepID=UPI0006987A67|nr:TetR/AcrR family transcriptional regulator [Rhodococcus sp. MEB064]
MEQTRQDIFDAAAQCFARAGFTAVTLKEIARDAGVTAPLIVHYFGSKRELFRSIASADNVPTANLPDLNGPLEGLGLRIAERTADYFTNPLHNYSAMALVRSLDDEEARLLFAAELERRLIWPLTDVLIGPDPEARAEIITSSIMGFGLFALGALLDPPDMRRSTDRVALKRATGLLAMSIQVHIDTR